MVSIGDGYSCIIQIKSLYVPQLNIRMVFPQGIDTQEVNPVVFGVYGRCNRVNTKGVTKQWIMGKHSPYHAADDHDLES